jgi:hypothetical protein
MWQYAMAHQQPARRRRWPANLAVMAIMSKKAKRIGGVSSWLLA